MNQNVRRITLAALGAALVCICTSVFKFPIPLGYAHLGNCMILLFGVFFDPWIGAFAGGVGSAISDLLGLPGMGAPHTDHQEHHGLCGGRYRQEKRASRPRCVPFGRCWPVIAELW